MANALYLPGYRPGDNAFLYYADEAAAYNPLTSPIPAIPSGPTLAGYIGIPGFNSSEGGKNGFANSSPFAQYTLNGARVHEVTFTLRIAAGGASLEFLKRCLRTSTLSGSPAYYYGQPQLCLYVGSSDRFGGGFTRVLRWASCSRVTITLNEGGAQEITAQCTFMGIMEQASSSLTPTVGALSALGAPVAFQNLLNFYIGQPGNYRDFRTIAGTTTISVDNSLEAKSIQPDLGDNVANSRIPYALLPHNEVATFSSTWHDSNIMIGTAYATPGLAPLRTSSANATDWSQNENLASPNHPIQLVVNNTASGTSPATVMTINMELARLESFNQPEADSNTEQMGQISALVSQVSIV